MVVEYLMSYYTIIDQAAKFTVVTVFTGEPAAQVYVDGVLADSDLSTGEVRFNLTPTKSKIHLLTVAAVDVDTSFWSTIFSDYTGDRLTLSLDIEPEYDATDKVKYYLDSVKIAEKENFDSGGWGSSWGVAWGLDTYGAGWGNNWGSLWSTEKPVASFETSRLSPGDYTTGIAVIDSNANESTIDTEAITLDTYPDEPSSLTVLSSLVINFTASEDL